MSELDSFLLNIKEDTHPLPRLCQNSELKERSSTDYADAADFFPKRQTNPTVLKWICVICVICGCIF